MSTEESKTPGSSNNPDETRALIGRRPRCGMKDSWNQFGLLFTKNLILAKRSKLWVFFELLLPCLFTLPIVFIVVKYANVELIGAKEVNPVTISGDASDLPRNVRFTSSVEQRWRHATVEVGYNTDVGGPDLDRLMDAFFARYAGSSPKIVPVKFDNRSAMIDALKEDIYNISVPYTYIGTRYAGGIEIKELNLNERKLSYNILVPNLPSAEGDVFKVGISWNDPYGPDEDFNRIPPSPPYWSSGFLTLQLALDSVFINQTGGSELPPMQLHRLPDYSYKVHSVGSFVKYLPILWGLCAFVAVLHAGREVSHEKATVKSFLSVMGLSAPMFYLSHVLFSYIKCIIIFLVCAIPLSTVMTNTSVSLFLFTVSLYGLGVVIVGVLIASMFKGPDTVSKFTVFAWVVLVALPYFQTPRTDQLFLCFLSSLNINGAFYFAVAAISDNMYRESPLGWSNMFSGGSYQFTIGYALIMMVVDILWMSTMTLVIDYVFGSSDFNLRAFFARENIEEADSAYKPLAVQDDEAQRQAKPDIEVSQLVKIWPTTGERAVDNFFLNACPGGVTVLLGHNGAGKSTTFSILSGLVKPTSGVVKVCGEDVIPGQTHHNVGLCPQGNALFDKLTVDEHLWLINGLKGSKDWAAEGDRLKFTLGLMEKGRELSMHLSGGMKRKLCVCLALIGNSKVVLLDEPTAGMDPGARQDVIKLLEEEKQDRTILLTTHYMEEAELLGDQVAIMCTGRLAAYGTPDYLKDEFGTGYILTVVVEEGTQAAEEAKTIAIFVNSHLYGAVVGKAHGRSLEIILPKDGREQLPVFLKELEKEQQDLKIASFGLSLNTLEQVFLKVGEMAMSSNGHNEAGSTRSGAEGVSHVDSETDLNKRLILSQQDPIYTGAALVVAQLRAIVTKRSLYFIRNWPQLFTQVVIPVLFLVLMTWLSNFVTSSGGNDYFRSLTREDFGPSRVVLQVVQNSPVADTYRQIVTGWPGSELVELDANDNLTARVIELPKTIPATAMGAVFSSEVVSMMFNKRAPHAIVTSVNLVSNARIRTLGQGSISTGVYAFSQPASSSKMVPAGMIDTVLGPMMMIALALVTSTFVMFYVEERKSKFAHQQSLTGVSPLVFWGGSLVYDFIFYTFVCAAFMVFFLTSGWLNNLLGFAVLLWFLYFWAVMPFIYTVSFIFSSPSKANVLLISWQIVAALAAVIVVVTLTTLPQVDRAVAEIVRTALLMFLPSFALGNGLMTLGTYSSVGMHDGLWQWDQLGKNIACMAIFGLLSFAAFIAFQFKVVRRAFNKIWDIRATMNRENSIGDEPEDVDVVRNRTVVSQQSDSGSLLLEVHEMSKYFGRLRAVDHLTMGVQQGECFGLLGVNGAGKTTTFDILTGQSFATKGYARIDNRDVTEHIAIGYCPQFDAMMMDYTGREILTMMARMYGFKDPQKKTNLVLDAVGMQQHGNKRIQYCSGGQRRKISVGLALLACTKIVILDEPTAGIDPKARREVWNVLTAVRNNSKSALLLTSHSMDECEALCTRIAVLKKGRMIAIGEAQHLKSRFGNNFTLTMVAPTFDEKQDVIDGVLRTFPDSNLKTHSSSNSLTLKWQLPRGENDLWSTKFAECQKLAHSLGVKEFCLTQSSLEETFLRISNEDDTSLSQ